MIRHFRFLETFFAELGQHEEEPEAPDDQAQDDQAALKVKWDDVESCGLQKSNAYINGGSVVLRNLKGEPFVVLKLLGNAHFVK